METYPIKQNKFIRIAALAVLILLVSSACSLFNFGIKGLTTRGDRASVTIELKEDEVNRWFKDKFLHVDTQDELLEQITSVDMHEGVIRVFGTYRQADGTTADGSYDVSLGAEDGKLLAKIVAVDIQDLAVTDERVQKLNDKLAQELSKVATESRSDVQFTSVSVTEDTLKMVIDFDWKSNR